MLKAGVKNTPACNSLLFSANLILQIYAARVFLLLRGNPKFIRTSSIEVFICSEIAPVKLTETVHCACISFIFASRVMILSSTSA